MNARAALLAVLGALVVVLVATLVDRQVLAPRREATRLVERARPLVGSTNEAEWLGAESLLAQAELLQRGRADIADLRAQIASKRVAARAEDDKIMRQALDACLSTIEKSGHGADAAAIRGDLGKTGTRDLHVRCMKVQLQDLGHPAKEPVPSAVASAIASGAGKSCPPGVPLCP